MVLILNLETATTNCSISLAKDGKVVLLKEHNSAKYSHAEQLHVFIDEVFQESNYGIQQLDAVAVSKGPGSYTGLRIGVSAAKGLCFSLDVPLISVPTLQSLALQILPQTADFIIPVLDARRMEVYSAVFDNNYGPIRETQAEIVDEDSFSRFLNKGKTVIVGNGAEKCQSVIQHQNAVFAEKLMPSARDMALLSYKKFRKGDIEDVAYFEPYYLKDFVIQTKIKK